LAILLDASASIGEDTFNLSKDLAKALLRRFTISTDNARVSIVAYSQHINIQSRFSDDQDEGKLEEILGNTLYEGSTTGTGKTMQAINFEVFSAKSGSRIGHSGKQFIVQSTKKLLSRRLMQQPSVQLAGAWFLSSTPDLAVRVCWG